MDVSGVRSSWGDVRHKISFYPLKLLEFRDIEDDHYDFPVTGTYPDAHEIRSFPGIEHGDLLSGRFFLLLHAGDKSLEIGVSHGFHVGAVDGSVVDSEHLLCGVVYEYQVLFLDITMTPSLMDSIMLLSWFPSLSVERI